MEIRLWLTMEIGFDIGFLGFSCFLVSFLVVEVWLELVGVVFVFRWCGSAVGFVG